MDFSKEQLNTLTSGLITPGEIYRLKLTEQEGVKPKKEGDDGRNKYFVVLGSTDDNELIGFVLINSEINRKLPQEIQTLHYKITAQDYPFLKKDRYLCCSELKQIESSVFFKRCHNKAVATLSDEHLEIIKRFLAQSPKVSLATMHTFGLL
ncbi:hypothetical protein [Prevotella pallens]|uniref:hypothetical protein n=1 Tax=Prevotella pallens TaxID=60133 RepID=UPI00352F2FFC